MTDCISGRLSFPACRGRRVEAGFDGGEVTSNGGALLLRQADRRLGLTAAVARRLGDTRQRGKLRHGVADLLRQRIFGIALGYEDLNDHAALRHDLALQTAAGRGPGSGQRGDAVPLREPGRTGLGVGGSRGSGRDLHRLLRAAARRDCAGHGCHRRCGARPSGGALLPRLLRPLLLPAAVCVRRRSPAGGLSAAGRHRPGEAFAWHFEASGRAPAPGLARGAHRGAHRGAGRFRLLPLATDALVRASRRRLHPRPGQERPARCRPRRSAWPGGPCGAPSCGAAANAAAG